MKLHPAGRGTIIVASLIYIALLTIAHFCRHSLLATILTIVAFAFIIIILQFFRYPNRAIKLNEKNVISPADGKICVIEEVEEKQYLNRKCKKVSIFMSPFNVHINWAPVPGKIMASDHIEGKFLAAFKDKAADENERYSTLIKMDNGTEILATQVAGALARRILNFKKVDDIVTQETEIGFIRFGSRVDLYLPLDTKLNVKLGDKVTGSQTIIGEL